VSAKRVFSYLGWPTFSGLLLATLLLVAFPQLLTKHNGGEVATGALSPDNLTSWLGPASYSDAVTRAAPAVVNIYTTKRINRPRNPLLDDPFFRRFFNSSTLPQRERMQSALGSGVILASDGFILTNNHVVKGASQILVQLADGRSTQARIIGEDPDTDLAVLKIGLTDLTPISIGNSEQAKVGDVVLAIGNPFGVGQTVTQGIISATGRDNLNLNTYDNFLQTDAAINPGNSGGALVDAYGNLLGISNAILDKTGFSVGIGFAIPADTAVKVLEDIVQHGRVIRGWLGVEARQLNPQAAVQLKLDPPIGLIITAIYNKGPAHMAGLKPGDIITHIDKRRVGESRRSMNMIAAVEPGKPIVIQVMRDGEILTITAVAGTRPSPS